MPAVRRRAAPSPSAGPVKLVPYEKLRKELGLAHGAAAADEQGQGVAG
ncbi:hypothetical protein ACVW0K_007269 [Streptomyces filamentosus]